MTLITPGQCMCAPSYASSPVLRSASVGRPGPLVSNVLCSSHRKFPCSCSHLDSCEALATGCHECAPTLCGRHHRDTRTRCHPCSQSQQCSLKSNLRALQSQFCMCCSPAQRALLPPVTAPPAQAVKSDTTKARTHKGWRDGSEGKSHCCSCKGPGFAFQH